ADFLKAGSLRRQRALLEGFDLIEQEFAREEPVQSLLPRSLALNLYSRRAVEQHDTSGGFVHVLPTVPARTDESFFNIRFPHPERGHPVFELSLLLKVDRECVHPGSVGERAANGNSENKSNEPTSSRPSPPGEEREKTGAKFVGRRISAASRVPPPHGGGYGV